MRALIYLWCLAAAVLLIVTAAAHALTFLPGDPRDEWPGIFWLHGVVLAQTAASAFFVSWACGRPKDPGRAFAASPRCLKVLTAVLFAYAFVNFGAFLILNEDGGPHERDGKYVLSSHGRVIRELTEAEYHRSRAYEVRGVSGHWMFFSAVSLMLLVGAARWRPGAGWEPEAELPAAPPDRGSSYLAE